MIKSKLARILSLSVCSALAVGMLTQVSFAASAPAPKGVTQAVASPQNTTYVNYHDTFLGYYSSIGTDGSTLYFVGSNPHISGICPNTMPTDSATAKLCRQYCEKITAMEQQEEYALEMDSRDNCQKVLSYIREEVTAPTQLSESQVDEIARGANNNGISSLAAYGMCAAWNLQADADSIYSSILSSNP